MNGPFIQTIEKNPEWPEQRRKLDLVCQEAMKSCDVRAWEVAWRRRLCYGGEGLSLQDNPKEILVSEKFFAALRKRLVDRDDILGGDSFERDGSILFRHIPVRSVSDPTCLELDVSDMLK